MNQEKFAKRFQELQEQVNQFPRQKDGGYILPGHWEGWASSCLSLIEAVFGKKSAQFVHFTKVCDLADKNTYNSRSLPGLFKSAKEDFDGGHVFNNLTLNISGEIFGNFVVLAKRSLAEGHKDVAAVLASAALEDALQRYAEANGLDVGGKSMTEVINAMKSKELVSGANKSLLGAMPEIRNHAMHANWDKITETDVGSMIGFVEQFLLKHFSSSRG